MQRSDDGTVWEWQRSFPIGLDCGIVTQNGSNIVEFACFVRHGDKPPVAISVRNFGSEDWGNPLSTDIARCGSREHDNPRQCSNSNQQQSDPFHNGASPKHAVGNTSTAFVRFIRVHRASGSKSQVQLGIYYTKVSIDTLVLIGVPPIPKYDGHVALRGAFSVTTVRWMRKPVASHS